MEKDYIETQALAILDAERNLQANEQFKAFMVQVGKINEMKKNLKEYLKDHLDTLENKEIVSPNGKQDYSFKLVKRNVVKCTDINKVQDDLLDYEEVDDVVEIDGKFYRLVPNIKAVKEQFVELGKELPDGFELNVNRALYATVNGEKLGL